MRHFIAVILIVCAACATPRVDVTADKEQIARNIADWKELARSDETDKIQPYFASGFPSGHDQRISHAGSAWATMALARAAEETRVGQPLSAEDPFVGTYVFNPAKSKMSGAPATAEMVLAISDEGDHLVIIPSGKTIDGAPLTGRLIVPKAGGSVPAPQGTVAYDLAVITRPNPHAIQVVRMRQGKELLRIRLELTLDGKILTRSIRATNAEGEPIEGMSVLERQ